MKRPFNIFPSIGYRNSQFQVISKVSNLIIDIYDQDTIIMSIEADSLHPVIITKISSIGRLTARCRHDNDDYEQEIEIIDAYRLGTSEFKKAYIFEDSRYSFFLMKDRLLLYDEDKNLLVTENHLSPTEIRIINQAYYLFITIVGINDNKIMNLGIYCTDSLSLVGELLNEYQDIKILTEHNIVWLYNKNNNTINCFRIIDNNTYFEEIRTYSGFDDYRIDDRLNTIIVNYAEKVIISHLNDLNNSTEIQKLPTNSVDKFGNVVEINGNKIIYTSILADLKIVVNSINELNLQGDKYIHVGDKLKSKITLLDLSNVISESKEDIISIIPENTKFYYHPISDKLKGDEIITTHITYPTVDGIYILQKEHRRYFKGIKFERYQNEWIASPDITNSIEYSLLYLQEYKCNIIINKSKSIDIKSYEYPAILVDSESTLQLYSGFNILRINEQSNVNIFPVSNIPYVLIGNMGKYSIYNTYFINSPVLEDIEILNADFVEDHQVIWYFGVDQNTSNKVYLIAYDLNKGTYVLIKQEMILQTIENLKDQFIFSKDYAIFPNGILYNPKNYDVKDSFTGDIEYYSESLGKIFSHRANIFYLSVFNYRTGKYELSEIETDKQKINESYLSPNGQYLVLQGENNKYVWYDIEKNIEVNYISGNFIAFRNDGSLIIEQDVTRVVKIIDPNTNEDITPRNYHYYRFMSPDGKLFAQISTMKEYINKLDNTIITLAEYNKYRNDLDFHDIDKNNEKEIKRVANNRMHFFINHKQELQKMGINDSTNIDSSTVTKIGTYLEIGISGTDHLTKIQLPDDISYYNYSAFSYDNKYFGYVGKPESKGLVQLFKIDFDEEKSQLNVTDSYLSRFPAYASWVCGFSKTGYFATYDSMPNTFVIFVDDLLFDSKTPDDELRKNIFKSKENIYHSYNKWNVVKGKNFLCFSPSGNFMALSEQGYEPLTLGGYGHQESNAVHIANTTSGKIINSFIGHGDRIKNDLRKKVSFVAFSEDEKKIMTLSSDGVVIIRDLDIKK